MGFCARSSPTVPASARKTETQAFVRPIPQESIYIRSPNSNFVQAFLAYLHSDVPCARLKKTVNKMPGGGTYNMEASMSSPLADLIALPVRPGPLADPDGNRAKLENDVAGFFDQFRDPLLRYMWNCGLPVQEGEEVVQDVFLSLFQHLGRGKPLDNVRGWLFRVAHNQALRRHYRRRRAAEVGTDAIAGEVSIDPAPNPEDLAGKSQTRKRLLAIVAALPEQDRRCLFLRASGLRYREIAGILDMSLGAVSLSLAKTLARIARSLESGGL
jgi:RNA polymerase sigma-70 factor, ECF subfamily